MRVGSLFSGIGGLDHGLARAGHEHVFFCESDEWRREVLRARFPGVPVFSDVRDVARREPTWGDSSVEDRAAVDEGRREAGAGFSGGGNQPSWTRGGRAAGTGHEGEPAGGERRELAELRVDLLCGGFPCQDLSVAGRRAGLAGNRSGLFFEFARIIDAVRPRWILIENVPGLLSSNGGRDFGVVLGTLADLGYGVAWRVLDSRFFGVPQRRRRVFIVGAVADGDPRAAAERAGAVLAVGSRCERHPAAGTKAGADVAVASLSGLGSGGPDDNDGQANRVIVASTMKSQRGKGGGGVGPEETLVAAPLTKGSASGDGVNPPGRRQEDDVNIVAFQHTQGIDIQPSEKFFPTMRREGGGAAISDAVGVRRLTPRECERLQGLPDDWTKLNGKTPDSRRYSALGDAVTATVGEWIGRRLAGA